jgi:phospholipid N-methyltransferase
VGVFLKRFLKDPRTVGAFAPSSSYLARKMLVEVEWKTGARVVEFGPGTGPFTELILQDLPKDAHYLGIELNRDFVTTLRARYPQAEFVEASVENLLELGRERNLLPIDHVVSGLPFASLPGEITERVLAATLESLRPGGTFTTFQYVHSYLLPPAIKFRRQMKRIFGPLHARRIEFRNLPPAMVFTWRKG